MKRNKALLLFLALIGISFVSVKALVESTYVSKYISEKITNIVSIETSAQITFNSIGIGLIPFSTTLKDVKVSFENEDIDLYVDLEEVKLSFSFISLLTNELYLEKLDLQRGEIKIDLHESKKVEKESKEQFDISKINLSSLFEEHYVTTLEKLPISIKQISFLEVVLKKQELSLELNSLIVGLFPQILNIETSVERIDIGLSKNELLNFDSLNFSASITKDLYQINNLKVYQELNVFEFEGALKQDSEDVVIIGDYSYYGGLDRLSLLEPSLKNNLDGFANLEGKLNGPLKDPVGKLRAKVYKLTTPYLVADELSFELERKEHNILLNQFFYLKNNGNISLVSPVDIFDLDKWEFLFQPVRLDLKNIHSNDFLYALRDDLEIIKARVSGIVDVRMSKDDILINPQDRILIENFQLKEEDSSLIILDNKKITGNDISIKVHLNGGVDIQATLTTGEQTKIKANGSVTKTGVHFNLEENSFSFEEFGKIAGVEIRGAGKLGGVISGEGNDVSFNFQGSLNETGVDEFNFGDSNFKIGYNLKTSHLTITDFKSDFQGAGLAGNGILDLSSAQEASYLKINATNLRFSYLFKIAPEVFSEIEFLNPNLIANFNGDLLLSGGLSNEKLKLNGRVSGGNLIFYEEEFNRLRFDFSLINQVLNFENISLEKNLPNVTGKFSVNTKTDYFNYELALKNLKLRDLNFYRITGITLDSDISGKFKGSGAGPQFKTENLLYLKNSRVDSYQYEDSEVSLLSLGKNLEIKSSIFGNSVELDSSIKENDISQLNFKVDKMPTKDVLNLLSEHNLGNDGIGGFVDLELNSFFNIKDFSTLDLFLNIKNLSFIKNEKYIRMVSPKKINIHKGVIKDWDIDLEGTIGKIQSKGRGVIRQNYVVESNLQIDADIVTLLHEQISRATGKINADFYLQGDERGTDISMGLVGENISLRLDSVIGNITEGNFSVMLENDLLTLNFLKAKYGRGGIEASGFTKLKIPYPTVNINYAIDNSQVPVLKNSIITLSGRGSVQGDSIPYTLQGNFSLTQGEISEDISDLSEDSGIDSSYSRFLPKENLNIVPSLINLNIDVDVERPIVVRNNLVELFFEGDISLRGGIESPLVGGRLNANPATSKFLFRGNEFKISEGEILFRDEQRKQSPAIAFVGTTTINKYNVKLEVLGPTDNLSINLSSEPQLSQSDLFSLLALGITSDVSKDLDETQRRSITTVGIGSLLADQLKINQGLSSSLGLKLSVLPEFSEDESSLLQGKSAVSDSGVGRIKSSTKVKIQKQLMEKVDMSVSSTVGGTLEQKQEMNINYNLNNNLSIEGIYEIRSSNEEQSAEAPTSLGIDFKFRRSFR